MSDFDPFDLDMDGDLDGIDFLGFDYFIRYVLGREDSENEEMDDSWDAEVNHDNHTQRRRTSLHSSRGRR
jgi:hypothetical protein